MKSYFVQFGSGDPRTFTGLSPTFLFYKKPDGTNVTAPSIAEVSTTGMYLFTWGTTAPIVFLADAATTSPGVAGRYVTGSLDPADSIDEIGTTLTAIGVTLTAIGNTGLAYGGTMSQVLTNTGATLVAIGNTSIAYGGTISVVLTNTGASLVAIGNTSIAIGSTSSQKLTNEGVTLVAIGNTVIAIGMSMSVLVLGIGSTASLIGDSVTDPIDLFGYVKRLAELSQGQEQFIKGSGALTMYDRTGATTLATRTISNNASLVVKS